MKDRNPRMIALAVMLVSLCFAAGFAEAYPNRVAATLAVGNQPQSVAIRSDGRYAFVTNAGDDTLLVIDLFSFQVTGSPITVGSSPFDVALNSDGSLIYVTNQGDNTVTVINGTDASIVATIDVGFAPLGIAVSPDDTQAFVANSGDASVSVIDTASNTVTDIIGVDAGPQDVITEAQKSRLYVSIGDIAQVFVFSLDNLALESVINVGITPRGLATTPDGESLLVADFSNNLLDIFETTNYTVEAILQMGSQPWEVAVSSDGANAYVTNSGQGTVSIIDAQNFDVLVSGLDVGSGPQGVAITPDGTYVLVVNTDDNTVSVLTEASFVTVSSVDPEALNGSTTTQSTITWKTDTAGDYQVEVGGDGIIGSGKIVDTGQASANTNIATVIQSSSLDKGDGVYEIFIYVTDSSGLVGRGATQLILDATPPDPPTNVTAQIGGSAKLQINWTASVDETSGIANYVVYFGTSSGSYDAPGSPVTVAGNKTGALLSNLEDGVTYYVAVQAIDGAGNESVLSQEASGAPASIVGATAGGGCFIQTVGADEFPFSGTFIGCAAAFFMIIAALGVRRSRNNKKKVTLFLVIALLTAATLFAPQSARAFDLNTTGVSWSFKAGYFIPEGDLIEEAYDNGGFIGEFTVSWLNSTNFETSIGVGGVFLDGNALDANGKKVGSVKANLFYIPVDLVVRYRFQFSATQPAIPYLGLGVIGAYYNEDIENQGTNSGWTYGYEGSLGCRVSISSLAPGDMKDFNRMMNTKDAYFFVEGKYSKIDRFGQQDFDLGGIGMMGGVELRY